MRIQATRAGRVGICLAAVISLTLVTEALAQTAPATAPQQLTIATRHVPPFAIKPVGDDEDWGGLTMDLWREIAAELNLEAEFVETEIEEMVDGVAAGRYDAAVAALTMTADRETRIDFSHPFYQSGLGIAVSNDLGSWWAAVRGIFSWQLLQAVGTLAGILLIVGAVVWMLENRKNKEEFGGTWLEGLGNGFWWSAVTMTTVGYGDKSPRTLPGRLVALVWMFASIIIISGMTAAIASALTVSQLGSQIAGPGDLPGFKVVTLGGSTAEAYLREREIDVITVDEPKALLDALVKDRADAAVYDKPILQYLIQQREGDQLRVLDATFERQSYAIGLPQDSPLRETLNRVLLEELSSSEWRRQVNRYLGE